MGYKIDDLYDHTQPPGIYFNMPNEVYHADASLSNSGMGALNKSPRKYWFKSPMNPDREALDTQALKQGKVLHTLLLEPHKFHEEWLIKKGVKNTAAAGMVGEGAYNDLQNAVLSLRSDKIINGLFSNGYPEVSIFWHDFETGVPCRARMDYLSLYLVADLKGVADTSDYSLGYSIADYGYYRQAAFYLHGIAEVKKLIKKGGGCVSLCPSETWLSDFLANVHDKFAFVWQEKTAPYITRADQLCERTIELGAAHFRKALHTFKENYHIYGTNPWPSGYEGRVGLIQLDDLPPKINYMGM